MPPAPAQRILTATLAIPRESLKEVNLLPNPLAIGVTFGGLLLDILVPRPKPRAGYSPELHLSSQRADSRTLRYEHRRSTRRSTGREWMGTAM